MEKPQVFATPMFSVVLPALNEAACIVQTLRSIPPDEAPVEVIVADGGSIDATRQLAAPFARVVEAPRGRAVQMNAGAALAHGDVLVFLHADTHLAKTAFSRIRAVLDDPRAESGAFRLGFDEETLLLRFYSLCTRLPLPQICFGDRALFVRRTAFEDIGGYPEIPMFEDLEMVRTLHRRGGFRFLPEYATTSARRFLRNGPIRQQLRNTYLWCHFMLGTDPCKVARHYPYENERRTPLSDVPSQNDHRTAAPDRHDAYGNTYRAPSANRRVSTDDAPL